MGQAPPQVQQPFPFFHPSWSKLLQPAQLSLQPILPQFLSSFVAF
jgi:hypothetical protein